MSTALATKTKPPAQAPAAAAATSAVVNWEDSATELERLVADYGLTSTVAMTNVARGLRTAYGMKQIYNLLEKHKDLVTMLAGSPIGFKTDKDNATGGTGYTVETVLTVATDALVRGLSLCNNEFNIICGRLYIAQEGYVRLVRELPGVTEVKHFPSVPKLHEQGATVKYKVTWKLDGVDNQIDAEIPVRINNGQGSDAILGKAKRKILHRVWCQITGSEQADFDPLEDAPITGGDAQPKLSKTADLAARLAAAKPIVTAEVASPAPANGALFDNGSTTPD